MHCSLPGLDNSTSISPTLPSRRDSVSQRSATKWRQSLVCKSRITSRTRYQLGLDPVLSCQMRTLPTVPSDRSAATTNESTPPRLNDPGRVRWRGPIQNSSSSECSVMLTLAVVPKQHEVKSIKTNLIVSYINDEFISAYNIIYV